MLQEFWLEIVRDAPVQEITIDLPEHCAGATECFSINTQKLPWTTIFVK